MDGVRPAVAPETIAKDMAGAAGEKIPGRAALLINSLSGGGAERVVTTLLSRLGEQGWPVELVCLERNQFYPVPLNIPVTYLSGAAGDEASGLKLAMLPVYALRLKRLVRRRGIAVVQSHLYRASYVNALARLLGSRHRVQVVNCRRTSLYRQMGLGGRFNLFLIDRLYRQAEVIVAKSAGMRDDLQALFRFPTPPIVIHNPYDVERIRHLADEEAGEPWFEPGLEPAGRRVILSVGRLIPLKRGGDILQAFHRLAGRDPDLQLVFLGEGEERGRLAAQVAAVGLAGRVHFPGNAANPFRHMHRAACLVLASFSEGFPNVLVEAMICGCPVVASDCISGPREILAPKTDPSRRLAAGYSVEEAGVLFAAGDVPALAEAVALVMSDPQLAGRLAEAGRRRALDFRQELIVERYRRLLWG